MGMLKKRKSLGLVLAATLLVLAMVPITAAAREWWIQPVSYTVVGRKPDLYTGSQSRIFLPEVIAEESDGITMDVNYKVMLGETVCAEGKWEKGAFVDLNGSGTYVFLYQGVDASNTYSFEIVADDRYPSIVLEKDVPLSVYTDEKFVLPAGKIYYGGSELEAAAELVMANGNRYQPDSKVIPERGQVTVTYSAQLQGERCSFSYTSNVLDRAIGFYDEAGNFYPAGTKAYDNQDLSGAVLNSASSLEYTYSEIVDLSYATKDVPLIVLNNASFTGTTTPRVRIVDVHDSQNYIEITGRRTVDNAMVVYSIAKAPNQQAVGHLRGKLYTQQYFGSLTTFATSAEARKVSPATYYYDAEEKAAYSDWYGTQQLISDFDGDYQTYPWAGFTTGEVYIVVLRSRSTDFICVESVCGHSLHEASPDTVAPELRVDMGEYDEAPYAISGVGYPIFPADAIDMEDSNVPVDVHVYKGYDAVSGVELDIVNGRITPYDAGNYTIVYTAQDSYANRAVRKINVRAYDENQVEDISAEVTPLPRTAFVGERLLLAAPENISGGSGTVGYHVVLTTPDGTETEVDGKVLTIPTEGVHTVTYVLTDYLGREKDYSFAVDCSISKDPILYEMVMPEYLLSGKEFHIPEAEYAEGTAKEVTVSAALDGVPLEIKDGTLIPIGQSAQSELVITYHAKSATGEASRSYNIAVLSGNVSDRCSFFQVVAGKMQIVQKENAINFETNQSYSGVRFINSVLGARFSLSLLVDTQKNDADRLIVIVTDALDPTISVRFDMVKAADGDETSKTEFYINGVNTNDMVGNFYGGTDMLSINYNRATYAITDALGNSLGTVTKTSEGEPFDGFPSGEVNIAVYAGEVGSRGFAFDLLQINNQTFYNDEMFFDNYAELLVNGTLNLQAELGSEILIPAAVASDVLSPNATVTVQIKKGNDEAVAARSAAEAFTYKLKDYATYQVIYQYSDGSMSRSASYTVHTVEHTAPKVGSVSNLPNSVKLGDRVNVPLPIVTDDHALQPGLTVVVREPNSNMILLNGEDTRYFTARYTGTYTVMYYAYDDCYNYRLVTHEITVTE